MRIRRRLRPGGGYSFDEEMSKSFAELRAAARRNRRRLRRFGFDVYRDEERTDEVPI